MINQPLEGGISGASANVETEQESSITGAEEGGDVDVILPLSTQVVGKEDLLKSKLMGNVFLRDDDEVGGESIHFDKQIGCFISLDHNKISNHKLDDGTPLPSRIIFTKQRFNAEERKFTGVTEYVGNWGRVHIATLRTHI